MPKCYPKPNNLTKDTTSKSLISDPSQRLPHLLIAGCGGVEGGSGRLRTGDGVAGVRQVWGHLVAEQNEHQHLLHAMFCCSNLHIRPTRKIANPKA